MANSSIDSLIALLRQVYGFDYNTSLSLAEYVQTIGVDTSQQYSDDGFNKRMPKNIHSGLNDDGFYKNIPRLDIDPGFTPSKNNIDIGSIENWIMDFFQSKELERK